MTLLVHVTKVNSFSVAWNSYMAAVDYHHFSCIWKMYSSSHLFIQL